MVHHLYVSSQGARARQMPKSATRAAPDLQNEKTGIQIVNALVLATMARIAPHVENDSKHNSNIQMPFAISKVAC
jgi:hypothetical protein